MSPRPGHEPTELSHRFSALPLQSIRVDVVEGPSAGGTFEAERESLTIGSADGNDLVIADPTLSRYHVEITRHASGGVLVVDHGSTNGTFAGSIRIERAVVPAGTYL